MNPITRPPYFPYGNLLLAALIGTPSACVVYSFLAYADASAALAPRIPLIVADGLAVSLFAAVIVVPMLLLYAMPLLWVALRKQVAGPATAFAVALLPGLIALATGSVYSRLAWLPLLVCAAIGTAFLLLAYRRLPSPENTQA